MLVAADTWLFRLGNGTLTHPLLDRFMPFITELSNMWPLILAGLLYLLFGAGHRYRHVALLLPFIILAADTSSSRILKPLVHRQRPCCTVEGVHALTGCKKSLSFPSSHAANTAAVAGTILQGVGPQAGLVTLAISLLICWSRVYVGVHFPIDVTAGFFLGLLISWIGVRLARRYSTAWRDPPAQAPPAAVTTVPGNDPPSSGSGAGSVLPR